MSLSALLKVSPAKSAVENELTLCKFETYSGAHDPDPESTELLIVLELGALVIKDGDVVSELAEKAIPMLVATFDSLVTLNK